MTKNEYILCLENLIVNRVKYHAPRLKEEVDYPLLDAVGIDGSYPIFIFNRPLDKIYYRAFLSAKKQVEFNLILTQRPLIRNKKIEKLDKTFTLYDSETGSNLNRTLEALNVNYLSHSSFKKELRREYLSLNGKEILFDFMPYYLSKKLMDKGIILDAKCYLLNGKNYYLSFSNTSNEKKVVQFEFNLPLPRGYYFFKRGGNFIQIENLINRDKAYFNYNIKNSKVSFSCMDGLDSCTFACIRLECKIELLPKETRKIYFNFGENKYCISNPKDMAYFFEISQRKMNEIFDTKVTTRDVEFDELFNLSLPRNIWEKWQNFDVDEASENSYVKLRNEIVKNEGKSLQISNTFKGLKEVKLFRNGEWKRVFIVHNKACYLFADKVKYYNFTLLTKELLEKNSELYLSFAE